MTAAFPMIEMALKAILEERIPSLAGKVGGDLSYDADSQDIYVWLGLVPGGATDRIEGTWNVDIDVFAKSYADAMNMALALEAALVGPRLVTGSMRLDNCYQNLGPTERPWPDDNVFRIGATYVFTARRSG